MAASVFSSIRASAADGHCHNTYFRQEQLKNLHDILRKNGSDVRDAIRQDTGVSEAEATVEYSLALSTVKDHYAGLDPVKELDDEYRIARGKDAKDRMEPVGVVYIEPNTGHTPFFSILTPVSASLAAGNCVVLKVSYLDLCLWLEEFEKLSLFLSLIIEWIVFLLFFEAFFKKD